LVLIEVGRVYWASTEIWKRKALYSVWRKLLLEGVYPLEVYALSQKKEELRSEGERNMGREGEWGFILFSVRLVRSYARFMV